jgi:hypothetical protein
MNARTRCLLGGLGLVALICHGLPGNEKHLDLAQAVRRAGWLAVTFNYRGSWGSQGVFVATDHGWSDRRIELEAIVIDWLMRLPTPVH